MDERQVAEVARSLYGDASGRWLLLTTPVGLICPPHVDVGEVPGQTVRLQHLGPVSDVLAQIHNAHRGSRRPAQQALADMLGVSQQRVSWIINGRGEPKLRPESWVNLVRIWFASQPPYEVPDER